MKITHLLKVSLAIVVATSLLGISSIITVLNNTYSHNAQLTTALAMFALTSLVAVAISIILMRKLFAINSLENLVSNLADGHLHTNIDKRNISNDEFGALTNQVHNLAHTIKNLINDLITLTVEYNVNGNVRYRADATKYTNDYSDLVLGINEILASQSASVLPVIAALDTIGAGDFDIYLEKRPGERDKLANSVRNIKTRLENIYGYILHASEEIANGNLDVQIDETIFEGSWKSLIHNINNLVSSVATPIKVVETSLSHMSKGNFQEAHIQDNFNGTFEELKNALNETGAITESYVKEISQTLGRVSEGDFTVEIERQFIGSYAPIKSSIDIILNSLNRTMSEIFESATQVLAGSTQISSSAMSLADGATKQSSAVSELNTSINQITKETLESSQNAKSAKEKAMDSSKLAQQGVMYINNLSDVMDNIKESSEDITKVIKVIEDIAFQTNLLALNASVEAARAGEHGRGFSVVAEEVRSLAGKSQDSTANTTKIIEADAASVAQGLSATKEVNTSFTTISTGIDEITDIVTQISELLENQAHSISEINSFISDISDVVHSNTAVAEEVASSTEELSSQAEVLQSMLAVFKLKDR